MTCVYRMHMMFCVCTHIISYNTERKEAYTRKTDLFLKYLYRTKLVRAHKGNLFNFLSVI